VSALDDSTLVVCMIEPPEGEKNVEEIAKVDGWMCCTSVATTC
jgi:2-keto-3-deoxy-L-rhamnonate aldolase RhmA